jgi:DNA modification methylase
MAQSWTLDAEYCRRYIGIELDPVYAQKAQERLKRESRGV